MLSNCLIYLFALTLCFTDVLAVGFFGHKILFSLLCLYTSTLFHKEKPLFITFSLLLLATQSLMLGESFSFHLLYLVPLSIIALEAKKFLHNSSWLPYLFMMLSIIIQSLLNPHLLFTSTNGILFIFTQICVNLIIMILFEKTLSQR